MSAGGAVRWTTTGMNARQQVTSGQYGSNLGATFGYDSYGFPTSAVAGTIQNISYNFNPATGNLNWRQNNKHTGLKEDFQYDNLDRLDNVYMGGTMTLDMDYDSNKGGITTKSDVGTMLYNTSGKPYAISGISLSTGLTPSATQSVTYTSFEKVSTISENNYSASFVYNSNNERAQMVVQQGSGTVLTRWYPGSRYLKETGGSTTKEYTYIGGDAYSAPVVAITQNSTTTYYNLLRDNLGSITHVVNSANNELIAEYSYDAWGRMRDPATWVNYTPGSEPALFVAGRGYTGHEHLPWFNLINMNGRVYDPLTGTFLSPDSVMQDPGNTQNYNRYAYCLNNPLKYTDPSGYKLPDVAMPADNVWTYHGQVDIFDCGFAEGGGGYGYGGGYIVGPGQGLNGPGLNGVYYDWYSGRYRSTNPWNDEVRWGDVYDNCVVPNSYAVIKDFQKAYALAFYNINDYNATLTAGPGGPSGQGGKSDGMVYSFSFDFAFGGGAGVEIGLVTDKNGGKKLFISGNANIGFGISAGPSVRSIQSIPGLTFKASDYKGYSNGFNIGIGPLGYSNSGDKISGQWSFDGLLNYGKSYKEEGWGYSLFSNTPTYGVIWFNTSTKFIQR